MEDDVATAIMDATCRALCEHGYAQLTMQDIADEWGKTTAALHYHYDSKRALLLAFLEHLYEPYATRVSNPEGETPIERIATLIEAVLSPPDPAAGSHQDFATAMLELTAQAPYDEAIRERMVAFDEVLYESVRTEVAAGVDSGVFRDVDPDATARFVVTVVDGARAEEVAIGQDLGVTQSTLETYVEDHLVRDGQATRQRTGPDEAGQPK